MKNFIEKNILKNFFKIELSNVEKELAAESLKTKYVAATKESFIYGLLALPTTLFIDTSVLVSVLIPITMVSGTAWFAVSLSSVKKKFENFGLELTADMFRSFVASLVLLFLLVLVPLNTVIFSDLSSWGKQTPVIQLISGLIGTLVIFKITYDIYAGSLKYDINDTMLAGQSEAAEKYFKKSLSLLNSCAENLKKGKGPEVSNYFIGLAFYEILTFVIATKGYDEDFQILLKEAENLKSNPGMERIEAEKISIHLIEKFLQYSTNISDEKTKKSLRNIQLELNSLRENKKESDEMVNIRFSVIFEEMSDMLENQGDGLFKKRQEIEKKYLVKVLPNDIESYPHEQILQGYLKISNDEEIRIRKRGNRFFYTTKKSFPSGYREETEEFISKEKFEKLWPDTKGRRIEKIRYLILYKDLTIELDKFNNRHEGLLMAEVEFDDENTIKTFQAPEWFGEDVTMDKSYKNQTLAG